MVIRDDILDDIVVPAELTGVVSHAHFQRLRGIGQTGLLYLVYPGMKHTRFEHSLGAMHLSLAWFEAIKKVFEADDARKKFYPLHADLVSTDGTKLLVMETEKHWKTITSDERWKRILSAAALLHDVGHGPFSHSIESYGLLSLEDSTAFVSDSRVEKFVAKRKKEHDDEAIKDPSRRDRKKLVNHEDFSVVLAYKILSDAKVFENSREDRLYVCALISKDFRAFLAKENVPQNSDDQMMLRLLAPLISGLFDVDRMDYMRRDSVKAGVKYGLAEVQRLMSCLIPTLVALPNGIDHDVNIITRARNIHSVDHFLVALFQLYTTLYMHPSYEGYQHELGLAVEKLKEMQIVERITLADYANATDAWLIGKLNTMDNLFNDLVSRKFKAGRESFQTYSKTTVQTANYTLIGGSEREIIKDGVKVWLIDKLPDEKTEVRPWDEFSLVARNLKTVKHTPHIWWKNPAFGEALKKIKPVGQPASAKKRKGGTGSP